MHDVTYPAVPATRSPRVLPGFLALVVGAIAVGALLTSFFLWLTLLAKLDWWESEDWALPIMFLSLFTLPVALSALAMARRIGMMAHPPTDDRARRSRWGVRLAGLPFLLLPMTFLVVWSFWVPYVASDDSPTPDERTARLVQLAVMAAVGLGIAVYGWVVPRATFRGWLRAIALGTAAALLVFLAWNGFAALTTLSLSDVWSMIALSGPLLASCGLVALLTRPER